jgi:diaphanous 1
MNTLKALPLALPVPNAKAPGKGGEVRLSPTFEKIFAKHVLQGFHGLVQRLVQKEKQVLQLQAELDRFKAQHPNEGRDAVSGNAVFLSQILRCFLA